MLPDDQLLVAAGDSFDDLHVFRFDATTGEEGPKSLTTGDHKRVQPRAQPGPDTLIYSRKRESGQPAAAMADQREGDRPCSTRAR